MADYSSLINAAATKYGVDPAMARAVAGAETGTIANAETAVSTKGAIGVMQLTPGTASDYGVNPRIASENIDGGVHYLADLQNPQKYPALAGDNANALIAYNWGPGNMQSFLTTGKGITSQNIPAESLNYANQILTEIGDEEGVAYVKELGARTPGYTASTVKKPGSGSPQAAIVNLKRRDAPKRDQSKVVRNKDLDGDSDIMWQTPTDHHQAYFATAEILVGKIIICPLAPINDIPSELHSIDNETPGTDVRLEEFQYQSTTQGGNRILCRLFLKSWADVVRITALLGSSEDMLIRFGYTNIPDGMTPQYRARILSTTPEFLENGYSMSIEAIDADAAKNLRQGSKNQTWRAEAGRISDIADEIAKENGWKTCIESSEALDPNLSWNQNNQSDLHFLNYVLGPNAKSDVTRDEVTGKVGPYVAYLHPDIRNGGAPILHFHPLKPSSSSEMARPQRDYIWGGVSDAVAREFGTVISFNPQFEPTAYGMLGASRMAGQSMDVDKKILNIVECSGTNITELGIGGDRGPVSIDMADDEPTRTLTLHEHEADLTLSKIAARYFRLRDYAFSATMTVQGDPFLRGGIIVNVQALRPLDGSIMFYDWFITEVIHQIANGEYVCNLQMVRTSVGPNARDASLPGLGVGLGQYTQRTLMSKKTNYVAVGSKYSE